jgi:hypothetical protein
MMFLIVYLGGDFLWRKKDKRLTPILTSDPVNTITPLSGEIIIALDDHCLIFLSRCSAVCWSTPLPIGASRSTNVKGPKSFIDAVNKLW